MESMDFGLLTEKEFFSIGEVSRLSGTKPYVIRYWESLGLLKPSRRDSGQRKFTRRDVETVAKIKELLYDRGFTTEGAKKYLRQQAKQGPAQIPLELEESSAAVQCLRDVKRDLTDLLRTLKTTDYKSANSA
jgi:DNA-binding transcriptional MerR regulator